MQLVDYVFLFPGPNFPRDFVSSWTKTLLYLERKGYQFHYYFAYGPGIAHLRNNMVAHSGFGNFMYDGRNLTKTIPFAGELRCKKVIFIDSDMTWTEEDIEKLINSPYDITTGVCPLSNKYESSVKFLNSNHFEPIESLSNLTEPFEIESSGLSFMSINFEVFETVPYPWFNSFEITKEIDGVTYASNLSEDVYFIEKCKENGFKVYLDPTIKMGHIKTQTLKIE